MIVVGHRGAPYLEPENTLRSIERAARIGVDAVEVDIRFSRDGVPVAIHDPDLTRVARISAKVSELTLAELKKIRLRNYEHIPTLREVLDKVSELGIDLLLELKESGREQDVLRVVEEHGYLDRTIFISFHHPSIYRIKLIDERARIGSIFVCEPLRLEDLTTKIGAEFALPRVDMLTESIIESARDLGVKLIPWVVNDPELAKRLEGRVYGISTDKPDLIIRALRGKEEARSREEKLDRWLRG